MIPTASLLTGGMDEYFQRTDSTGAANFLADALGSTVALTNSSGSNLAQYTYDPFGNTAITGSSTSTYEYTGRENDGAGLYFNRARYYNPQIGRFISEDPLEFHGGDANLYAYVWNSPPNFVDPFGWWGVGGSVGASASVGGGPGIGGTQSWGGMYFPSTNTSGGYMTTGAFAGCHSAFGNFQNNNSGGIGVGVGPGITLTNANSIQQLGGTFNTTILYAGPITIEGSYSGGTWMVNVSGGGGGGVGYAQLVTDTFTNPVSPSSSPLPSGSERCGCH